jgi:hypothetical protein
LFYLKTQLEKISQKQGNMYKNAQTDAFHGYNPSSPETHSKHCADLDF